MALITCRDAAFSYDHVPVVRELNFSVEQGDYLCIVGENGSGKSTLLKGLLGLKQPSSGSISWGENLRPRDIGYLPQQTMVQKDFPASVYEVVLSGRLNSQGVRPFYSRQDKAVAAQNMFLLKLESLSSHCYRDLSGGQQQRVLLARALCAAGRLLLLDEPVAGLDPVVSAELYQLIKDINEKLGMTIIMVSHDIDSILKDARSILHLQEIQRFFGPVAAYRHSEIGRRFLGGIADDCHNS